MTTFNKQELLHIAKLSALKLEEHEIEVFTEQIKTILSYVDQLKSVDAIAQTQEIRNINIFRQDEPIKTDSAPILAQAPAVDEKYFSVPKILDEK
jgi:aspartyl-tRNA(Asn)/glutamyl-tRNA(Gln) amidotransferase subunit C